MIVILHFSAYLLTIWNYLTVWSSSFSSPLSPKCPSPSVQSSTCLLVYSKGIWLISRGSLDVCNRRVSLHCQKLLNIGLFFFFSYCEIFRITYLLLGGIICLFYILLAFKYNCFIKWKSFGNLKTFLIRSNLNTKLAMGEHFSPVK